MSSYSAKELIKILEQHGWYEVRQVGSHKQFKHPNKPNKITVPITQVKKNIEMRILRQAGLKHLMKRRNAKPQPKKPQAPYKAPEILYGLSQTPDAIEAAKNTPCLSRDEYQGYLNRRVTNYNITVTIFPQSPKTTMM